MCGQLMQIHDAATQLYDSMMSSDVCLPWLSSLKIYPRGPAWNVKFVGTWNFEGKRTIPA
jgi:hypothetical protein